VTLITIWDLRRERGPLCEWCHKRPAEQRHHALVPDLRRWHEELTVKENIMQACAYCHTGICVLDSYEVRQWFWGVQCKRYGVDHMTDWVHSLPDKLRISGRLDFVSVSEKTSPRLGAQFLSSRDSRLSPRGVGSNASITRNPLKLSDRQ
jgi:hypothetical protein